MNKQIKKLSFAIISLLLCFVFSFGALAEELMDLVPVPVSYALSRTKYVYTGKEIKPSVVLKDKDGNVISGEHYKVAYSSNKLPGKAKAIITLNNSGAKKSLTFTICPKTATTPSVKSLRQRHFVVTVGEDLTVTGYNIRYSAYKSFKSSKNIYMGIKNNLRKNVTTNRNTTYYVKVRNYKTVGDERIYGSWSKTVKVVVTSKSAHAKLPLAMMESYVADSLTYAGYKTAKHKAMGTYLRDLATGPRTPMSVRSGIRYGGGPSGQETVKNKNTVTGRAPDLAYFRRNGLCCASFVAYYYLNYLPNIAGVNTSNIKAAIKKSGYASRTCEAWAYAGKYMVKKGQATIVDKVPNGSTLRAASLEKLEIGDLICFRIPSTGRACGHVAVYAGKNHEGDHYVAHVGSDEGPVFQTLKRFQNVVNRHDGCAYSVVYRFKGVTSSKYDYSIKLKTTKVKYTGKAVKPAVVIKDATGKTMSSKYYTVHYSSNVKVGTAYARVIFKGKHKGAKTLQFKIVK